MSNEFDIINLAFAGRYRAHRVRAAAPRSLCAMGVL
jgi:hypothetical protein